MALHRHTVSVSIKAGDPAISELAQDPNLRIMAFCAADPVVGKADIAFPHQSEVKVNGGEVKANLRGLKNKPGSTRPVDITSALRLRPPHFDNQVEMTFALTSKAGDDISKVGYSIPNLPLLSHYPSLLRRTIQDSTDCPIFLTEILFPSQTCQDDKSRRVGKRSEGWKKDPESDCYQ